MIYRYLYVISYKGSWLGGKAVVLANDKEHAIQLLKDDPMTINPEEIEIVDVRSTATTGVIFNDNGEY